MKPIILQLQIDATNDQTSVSQLLRKAKIAATKLELTEFLTWIDNELNGYHGSDSELPKYRSIPVDLKGFNPYRGWIPVRFADVETQKIISRRGVASPIGELEKIIESDNLQMALNPEAYNAISKAVQFNGDITCFVSKSSIDGILNAVKNHVLDVALKLEQEGILGDAISFSSEEKELARDNKIHIENIGNFSGTLGEVSGNATVNTNQVNYSPEAVDQIISILKEKQNDLALEKSALAELKGNLDRVSIENAKSTPNFSLIKEGLSSVRTILEGAAGNIIAQMAIAGISKLIGI